MYLTGYVINFTSIKACVHALTRWIMQKLSCRALGLVYQTLWSQCAYKLEIVSTRSKRVWSTTGYTIFVLRNRHILSIVDWYQTYLWDVWTIKVKDDILKVRVFTSCSCHGSCSTDTCCSMAGINNVLSFVCCVSCSALAGLGMWKGKDSIRR